jgi:uncharacterized protein YkwD
MRWIAAGTVLAGLAACAQLAPAGGTAAGSGAGASGGGGSSVRAPTVQEMAQLVNAHRRARGCPELQWLEPAARAAQAHSTDMARHGYFDHASPDGRQPWDRLAAAGGTYRAIAENIAYTPERSARQTLQGWIESPGHRRNLENCAYTHHGIGLQDARWTHLFVTPPAQP